MSKNHKQNSVGNGSFESLDPGGDLEAVKADLHSVENELRSLREELALEKDRYLRLAADFDNFRKRTNQETNRRAAAQKEDFIHGLLPILDNLERAISSTTNSTSCAQLAQGVQMTAQQLNQLLRRHDIEREESQGRQFDPGIHEAVAIRKDASQPDHVILETFESGYRRGNELFRPAKVAVNELASAR
jgi:molecular chaperone GrpE